MDSKANDTEQAPSIASMIIIDLKKTNNALIVANILLAIALILSIVI